MRISPLTIDELERVVRECRAECLTLQQLCDRYDMSLRQMKCQLRKFLGTSKYRRMLDWNRHLRACHRSLKGIEPWRVEALRVSGNWDATVLAQALHIEVSDLWKVEQGKIGLRPFQQRIFLAMEELQALGQSKGSAYHWECCGCGWGSAYDDASSVPPARCPKCHGTSIIPLGVEGGLCDLVTDESST